MENCIFCRIVAGDIPAFKVYEDADFLGFIDIKPINPGQTLLIPKVHFRWVDDLPALPTGRQAADRSALISAFILRPLEKLAWRPERP